jgi:hypothetical protein
MVHVLLELVRLSCDQNRSQTNQYINVAVKESRACIADGQFFFAIDTETLPGYSDLLIGLRIQVVFQGWILEPSQLIELNWHKLLM